MFDLDKWSEIFNSIRRHKLRTFLTAFSVWWGIFMLVVLLGAGKGLGNSAERDFSDDAKSVLWIWTNSTSLPYKGLPAGRWLRFNTRDYEAIDDLPETKKTSGRFWMEDNVFITRGSKSFSFAV